MNLRQIALVGLAALALGGTAVAQQVAQTGPSAPTTPPPPPPPNGSVATPGTLIGAPSPAASARPPTIAPSAAASASPAPGRRGRRAAPSPEPSASESPEPPQFSTMDGVWEVQMQPLNGTGRAIYSHFYLTQKGDALSGTWVRTSNEKLTLAGTFDGRLYKLTATDAKKNASTLSGYAENFSDMVGLMTTTDPKDKGTPFTAAHRKKERPGG
ncbi:MAG: hypothetical protein QOD51_183 [Candidatus Eremiobacteraeota bacterium]|nr:hypothetical protein [Candidatus Eremiobacteraeota bacterium]